MGHIGFFVLGALMGALCGIGGMGILLFHMRRRFRQQLCEARKHRFRYRYRKSRRRPPDSVKRYLSLLFS